MISVVICSVNKALAAQVKRNIDATIGTEWELLLMDNAVLKKGITEVYNMGAAGARFDILCFVHEDVLFRTDNWGQIMVKYFLADPKLGLVGVAGSKYKSRTLSGWSTGIAEFDCCNILHINKEGKEQRIFSNPDPGDLVQRVVTLDGVFLCCRKEVWQNIRFDDKLLKGFHVYDIDFSFRTSFQYDVATTFEIDMVHLTEGGSFGNHWLSDTLQWHQTHQHHLPRKTEDIVADGKFIEKKIARNWLRRLKIEGIKMSNKIKWLRKAGVLNSLSVWPAVATFFIYEPVKRLAK